MARVTIVDYGLANLRSVINAFEYFGAEVELARDGDALLSAERIVLPGVGHFDAGMRGLRERGHEAGLREAVLKRGIPYFGICLGMQFLLQGSEEGNEPGLGFIPGICGTFPEGGSAPKVPHIGWHDLVLNGESRLFAGLVEAPDVYFVHSFFVPAEGEAKERATAFCDYGLRFVAALERGNIFACQFHPEKSQTAGMKMIENFLQLQMAAAA
jgi:glutamine amidotransferase